MLRAEREHDLISEALIVKFVGRSDAAAAPYTALANHMTIDPRVEHKIFLCQSSCKLQHTVVS